MRTESRSWLPSELIDLANDGEVRAWAARLCVTPDELREIVEEIDGRTAGVAIEAGVPTPGGQDRHSTPSVGAPE